MDGLIRTHARPHSHTFTQPYSYTQPHIHTSTQPHIHTATHPHSHTSTQPHSHTVTQPHSHTATQPHSHTATQPHSHTATQPHSHVVTPHPHPSHTVVPREACSLVLFLADRRGRRVFAGHGVPVDGVENVDEDSFCQNQHTKKTPTSRTILKPFDTVRNMTRLTTQRCARNQNDKSHTLRRSYWKRSVKRYFVPGFGFV